MAELGRPQVERVFQRQGAATEKGRWRGPASLVSWLAEPLAGPPQLLQCPRGVGGWVMKETVCDLYGITWQTSFSTFPIATLPFEFPKPLRSSSEALLLEGLSLLIWRLVPPFYGGERRHHSKDSFLDGGSAVFPTSLEKCYISSPWLLDFVHRTT